MEIESESVIWILLAKVTPQCRIVMKRMMNIWILLRQ
jgi:hypothetical protein